MFMIKSVFLMGILFLNQTGRAEVLTEAIKTSPLLNPCVISDDGCMMVKTTTPIGSILRRGEIATQPFVFSYRKFPSEPENYFLISHDDKGLRMGVTSGKSGSLKVTTVDAALSTAGGFCYLSVKHPKDGSWFVSSRFQFNGYNDFIVESIKPTTSIVDFTNISSIQLINDAFKSVEFSSTINPSMQLKYKSNGKYSKGRVPILAFFDQCRTAL